MNILHSVVLLGDRGSSDSASGRHGVNDAGFDDSRYAGFNDPDVDCGVTNHLVYEAQFTDHRGRNVKRVKRLFTHRGVDRLKNSANHFQSYNSCSMGASA